MQRLGALLVGIAVAHVGCSDDTTQPIGGEIVPDSPPSLGRVFNVVLIPENEVPACVAASIYASGVATVVISSDSSLVTVSGLRYSDLSSPATAAHIHAGPAGVAGPIVFDLTRSLPNQTTLTFTETGYPAPPPAGAPPTFADFIAAMKAGNAYVNIHSQSCSAGEIRGQLR